MAQQEPAPFALIDDDGGVELPPPPPQPMPIGTPIDLPPGPPGETSTERLARARAYLVAADEAEAAGQPLGLVEAQAMAIHPLVQAAWEQVREQGAAVPSQRTVYGLIQGQTGAPTRAEVRRQVRALQARSTLAPQPDDRVVEAEQQVTEAQALSEAAQQALSEAQTTLGELGGEIAQLHIRITRDKSHEALDELARAETAYSRAEAQVKTHLPHAIALAEAALAAAQHGLAQAVQTRQRHAYNQQAVAEAAVLAPVDEALQGLLDTLQDALAHYDSLDDMGERLGIMVGDPQLPPKVRLTAYVLGALEPVIPAFRSGRYERLPLVPTLEGSPSARPLTDEDFEALTGTALVTFRQNGSRNDVTIPTDNEFTRRNFARGSWVTMSKEVYDALKAEWGGVIERRTRRSIWEA